MESARESKVPIGAVCAGLVLALLCGTVHAHNINTSYTTLIVRPDSLKLMVAIDENDLIRGFELDRNKDGRLWREEMLAGVDEVFDYVAEKVAVFVDGKPLPLERSSGKPQPDNRGNMFLNLFFRAGLDRLPAEVELEIDFFDKFGKDHKILAKILSADKPLQQAVFSPERTRQRFIVGERERSLFDELAERVRRLF